MSVARKTARAAIWAFVSTGGSKIITLIGLALLTRLLAPREFGLLAFVMVYITYVEAIGDLGSGVALVYWPDRRDDAAQVTFIINTVAGIGWCLLTLLLAPYVAAFFHAANGTALVRALAISFVIKFLGNTHDALTQKDLLFRARVAPDFALAGLKATVALPFAYFGYGAWSLVWAHLIGLAARTILLWHAVPWRPSLHLPRDLFKPMLAYGRGIIMVNVLGAVTNHADLAVVGRMLGPTVLGLYQLASKIPEITVVVLLWVLSKVLFPAFAKIHAEGGSLRQPYLVSTKYVTVLTLPSAISVSMLANPIITVCFGPAWARAAPILSMLAIYALLRCLSMSAGDVLKATGRAHLLARLAVFRAVLTVPALLIGGRYGAVEVAAALATVGAVATIVSLAAASRLIHVSIRAMAIAFFPATTSGAAMAAALFFWLRLSAGMPMPVQLFGGVSLGVLVYVAMLALLDRPLLERAKHHFLSRSEMFERAA